MNSNEQMNDKHEQRYTAELKTVLKYMHFIQNNMPKIISPEILETAMGIIHLLRTQMFPKNQNFLPGGQEYQFFRNIFLQLNG